MVAALIVPGSDVFLPDVMTNPLRTGLIATLREMGAAIETEDLRHDGSEEMAGLRVRASPLRGVEVPPERAPAMIDEYPVLAVAASFAEGTTTMHGLKELRVKESDRLAGTVELVRAFGAEAEAEADDLLVQGTGAALQPGQVDARGDHRMAMAAAIAGTACRPGSVTTITGWESVATSYPGFVDDLERLRGAAGAPG
jgi:3-phosphoshikimate 1-carboxyvinyltransferase